MQCIIMKAYLKKTQKLFNLLILIYKQEINANFSQRDRGRSVLISDPRMSVKARSVCLITGLLLWLCQLVN